MSRQHRPAMRHRVGVVAAVAVCALILLSGPLLLSGPPASAAPVPPGGWSPNAAPPADGMPIGGWPFDPAPSVSRGFEPPVERWGAGHRGVDLPGVTGQPVLAAADGIVGFAGQVAGRGVVTVIHGPFRTTYTPVTATVRAGQPVRRGEAIGTLAAGHCPGAACLHWGLLRGEEYLDPLSMITASTTAPAARPTVRMLPADAVARARALAAERSALGAGASSPSGRAGWVLPAAGPITSAYGPRVHPVTGVAGLHDGTDIGAPCGTPLLSPGVGTVVVSDRHPALGNRMVLDLGVVSGHRMRVGLAHAASYTVGAGAAVRAGQPLGRVGTTGLSTGCHLHLMLWVDGVLTDPMAWF